MKFYNYLTTIKIILSSAFLIIAFSYSNNLAHSMEIKDTAKEGGVHKRQFEIYGSEQNADKKRRIEHLSNCDQANFPLSNTEDILFDIFNYLPHIDKINVSLVCRDWYITTNKGEFLTVARFAQLGTERAPRSKAVTLSNLAGRFQNLTYLDISHSDIKDSSGLNLMTNLLNLKLGANATDGAVSCFKNLRCLTVGWDCSITDRSLSNLTNLRCLALNSSDLLQENNIRITDQSLSYLSNLEFLCISQNKNITDASIYFLRNLQKLVLYDDKEVITDWSIRILTNLTALELYKNTTITDLSLSCLSNLQCLHLRGQERRTGRYEVGVTNSSISQLTNLTQLQLRDCHNLTDDSLGCLTNLKALELYENTTFTDQTLGCYANLTKLKIKGNNAVTDASFSKLSNLTDLELSQNSSITDRSFKELSNLTKLCLEQSTSMTDTSLILLSQLKRLRLVGRGIRTITDSSVSTLNLLSLELSEVRGVTYESMSRVSGLNIVYYPDKFKDWK